MFSAFGSMPSKKSKNGSRADKTFDDDMVDVSWR